MDSAPWSTSTKGWNGSHLMLARLLDDSLNDGAIVKECFKATSLRFSVPCKHGERIKPWTPWPRRHEH